MVPRAEKNAMFQPSITAKNKHNGATVYIYIVYICFGPAIGRLALTSSGVIGLHRAELFMSELGIGWHREGIGRVHVGPSNKGNLRIQHDLTSERHREGIGKSWLYIPASGNVVFILFLSSSCSNLGKRSPGLGWWLAFVLWPLGCRK